MRSVGVVWRAMRIPRETATVRDWLAAAGVEPEVREPGGIVVRLATKQLDVPLLVHVDDVVSFDLYPFRFAGVNLAGADWPHLVQIVSDVSLIKIGYDSEVADEDGDGPIYYTVQIPLGALSQPLVTAIVDLLRRFAETYYETILAAVGLRESKPTKKSGANKGATKKSGAKNAGAKKPSTKAAAGTKKAATPRARSSKPVKKTRR